MTQQPPPEDQARQRFIVLTAIRLSGVIMAIIGFAVIAGKIDWPPMAGYFLVVVGALDSLIMPLVLIKAWRTPRQ